MLFEILSGPRGGKVYLRDGANYLLRSRSSCAPNIFLSCTKEECTGRAVIENDILKETTPHSFDHASDKDFPSDVLELRFLRELREACKIVQAEKPKTLFNRVFKPYSGKDQLGLRQSCTFQKQQRNIRLWRSNARKDEMFDIRPPQNLENLYQLIEHNEDIHQKYRYNDEIFIHAVPTSVIDKAGRSFALCCASVIKDCSNYAEAYIDATYKLYPKYIYQLLIINIMIKDACFPICYIFMERKTIEAYTDVFAFLRYLGLDLKNVMTDFEPALKRGIKNIFPSCIFWSCLFHFGQAILTNMKTIMKNKPDLELLRKLIAMAFMPANFINETYGQIKAQFPTSPSYRSFFKYFSDYWMNKVKPENFSVYGATMTTNNISEGNNKYIKAFIIDSQMAQEKSNIWFLLLEYLKFFTSCEQERSLYITSGFTLKIRDTKRIQIVMKQNVIKHELDRLEATKDGLTFVEVVSKGDYETYLTNLEDMEFEELSYEPLRNV